METRKFWCHYIGNDGNTPKRRNIELTDIHDILPCISNEGAKTPLWVEIEQQDFGRKQYWLYAQLSDKVAVFVLENFSSMHAEKLVQTDEDIDREYEEQMARIYSSEALKLSPMTDERIAAGKAAHRQSYDDRKKWRDRYLNQIRSLQDYDNYLLTGNHWISNACLRAYTEAESPIYPVLQALREQKLAEREADAKRRKEERKQRLEEEAKKKIEEDRKERERLMDEATKFRDGKSISGCDVVELCRRCSIDIHLRTLHNLQQVIVNINGHGSCQYYRQRGKRRPQLDGCYEVAGKLYHHLQEHYDELVDYMKECNKAA